MVVSGVWWVSRSVAGVDFPELDAPTCETCGTVVEGVICVTCERDAQQRRRDVKPVEP